MISLQKLFFSMVEKERDPFPKESFMLFILWCFPSFKIVFKVGVCIRSESWSGFSNFQKLNHTYETTSECFRNLSNCPFIVISLFLMILFYPKIVVWLLSKMSFYLGRLLYLNPVKSFLSFPNKIRAMIPLS